MYHTKHNVSGGDAYSFDSINWEDPSLYNMLLSAEELQSINAETTFPKLCDPPVANLSSASDTSESKPPSRTPSPIGNSRSEPLCNANLSTWAAHAQTASHKIKHDQKVETTKHIHDAVAIYLDKQKMKIGSLSHALNVTPKYINGIIGSHTKYHTTCKVQLTNALIHAKAKEMNTNQPVGSRYTLVELREMVANDPRMKS
ncbi:hypothetical protein BDR03DRAFT_986991 [Suillus americanus]|nr:hypothetical protein BDR03DRAFT_986991 [Suillus americanus]